MLRHQPSRAAKRVAMTRAAFLKVAFEHCVYIHGYAEEGKSARQKRRRRPGASDSPADFSHMPPNAGEFVQERKD